MQINSLLDILTLNATSLSFTNSTLSFDNSNNTARVTGSATVFGLPNQQLEISLSVVNGQLVLKPQVVLTSVSLEQLMNFGALPPSNYQANQLPSIVFSSVTFTPDKDTRTITISSTVVSGNLPLGINALQVANAELTIELYLPADGSIINQCAYFSGTLQIGTGVSVTVDLPRGFNDWNLSSINNQSVSLKNGLSDLAQLTPLPLLSLLPPEMPGISSFAVSQLSVQFSTVTPSIKSLQLTVGSIDTWTIVPNAISITTVSFNFSFLRWGTDDNAFWQTNGFISGEVNFFDVLTSISVPLSPSDGDWTLSTYPCVTIPGIGDLVNQLSSVIGSGDLSKALPPGLDSLGELTVECIEINFNPLEKTAAKIIKNVSVTIKNDQGWSLPYASSIQLTDIAIDLNIISPLNSSVVTGTLEGVIYIDQFYLPLLINRPTAESSWKMKTAYTDIQVSLPDLISVTGVDGNMLRNALPPSLSIINNLALTSLEVDYDISASSLAYVSFSIGLTDSWVIIQNYFEVTDIFLSAQYSQSLNNNVWSYLLFLSATIEVAEVPFLVTAGNSGPAGDWILTGQLYPNQTINLNNLLSWLIQQILTADFSLPSGFPVVTVTDMDLRITPGTGAFYGSLTSNVSWEIPFAQATFQISALTTTIDIGALPAVTTSNSPSSRIRPYTFTASGNFSIPGISAIQGNASFTTSNSTTPTIINVEVSVGNQIQAADVVNGLLQNGSSSTSAWDSVPVPADYTKPSCFLQADLTINLTDNIFLLRGAFSLPSGTENSDLYAAVALLVEKTEAEESDLKSAKYTYAIGATLKNWSFGKLSSSLSIIGSVLTVTDAAVVITTVDGQDITALTEYIPTFKAFTTDKRGLNFSATLSFESDLLSQIAQLLGISTQGPFTVRGYIPQDASQSTFEASLGSLTLLKVLSFNNITLTYKAESASTFILSGDVAVTVGQQYTFQGEVTVIKTVINNATVTRAKACITSSQTINRPLGIPALSFEKISFNLFHEFDGAQSDNQYDISGIINFANKVSLSGSIYFKNSKPVVTLIWLDQLDIGNLFATLFNFDWPSELLPIILKNGTLYYAPESVSLLLQDTTTQAVIPSNYSAGFFASTDIDIFFIKNFHVDISINDDGVSVVGGYTTPIDWGFITFYRGPTYDSKHNLLPSDTSKGPCLAITTSKKSNTSEFTLSGGFSLFDTSIASLLMNVNKDEICGRITLDQDLPPFGKPAFDFTWDEENGFQVEAWNLGSVKLPDFNFENVDVEGDCPFNGILEIPITSNVNITPSFSIKMATAEGEKVPCPSLHITIRGTLDLNIISSAYPPQTILSANIAEATFDVPFPVGGFTWSMLAESFVTCIKKAATSIFDNIIKDPQNLAKLLAVEGVVWAADQVKSFLTCRGASKLAAEAFVEAAASAIPSTVSILGVTVIGVGGISSSRDKNGHNHNSSSSNSSHHPKGGGGDPSFPTTKPNAPQAPTLSFANSQLTVSVEQEISSFDDLQYIFVIKCPNHDPIQVGPTSQTSVQVEVQDGNTYTAQVVATAFGGIATSTPSGSTSLTILDHVTISAVTYQDGLITASWKSIVEGAASYVGQVVDSNHAPLQQIQPVTIPFTQETKSLSIKVPDGMLSGNVYLSIQAITQAPQMASGNVSYSTTPVFALSAPAISNLQFSDMQIAVTLQENVTQALTYSVQLLNAADNSPIGEVYTVSVKEDSLSYNVRISSSPTTSFKIQLQANGAEQVTIPSSWAVSTQLCQPPAPPIRRLGAVGGNSGNSFDDTHDALLLNTPISQIHIRSGDIIDQIQAVYGSTALPAHGGNGGGPSTIVLDEGDILQEVSGYYGPWYGFTYILQLTFKTRKGRVYGPYGSGGGGNSEFGIPEFWSAPSFSLPTGIPFSFTAGENEQIIAFSGSINYASEADGSMTYYLSSLGVIIKEL